MSGRIRYTVEFKREAVAQVTEGGAESHRWPSGSG